MSAPRDVIVIGAGHNGLVAAAYLGKRGLRPLVLERRSIVGGSAVTEEIHPGFRCPTVSHLSGPLDPRVARDLDLDLEPLRPEVRLFAPAQVGPGLLLYEDPARTAAELSRGDEREGQRYTRFHARLERFGRLFASYAAMTPPEIDQPGLQDLWGFLRLGRRFRGLAREDAFALLRWLPMAVADLVGESFQTERLRAAIAARGTWGMFAGPWSAGTGANLLLQTAFDSHSAGPAAFVRGGPGALTAALAAAARRAGAEIRTDAEVARVIVRDGRAAGVLLGSGEEIPARAVVSNADPKRTFLKLVEPTELDPDFLAHVRNYRSSGSAAKVNLALSGLPRFRCLEGETDPARALSGRIHIGDDVDSLERAFDSAKYGDFSARPYCDVTIPSVADSSLAPPGAHVLSVWAQHAPHRLREGTWQGRRDAFGDAVVATLAAYAPGLQDLVIARQVLAPPDLEETYGLTGGHVFHGEPALDQLFTMRPLLGWARYRTPIGGLYLCGAGTHPGGGVTGAPGANAGREILQDLRNSSPRG
jgi:phytoene dehydrogenase-like protein